MLGTLLELIRVSAIKLIPGLQPAKTGDEKESQGVRTAASHEFPARVREISKNEHADSYYRGD